MDKKNIAYFGAEFETNVLCQPVNTGSELAWLV